MKLFITYYLVIDHSMSKNESELSCSALTDEILKIGEGTEPTTEPPIDAFFNLNKGKTVAIGNVASAALAIPSIRGLLLPEEEAERAKMLMQMEAKNRENEARGSVQAIGQAGGVTRGKLGRAVVGKIKSISGRGKQARKTIGTLEAEIAKLKKGRLARLEQSNEAIAEIAQLKKGCNGAIFGSTEDALRLQLKLQYYLKFKGRVSGILEAEKRKNEVEGEDVATVFGYIIDRPTAVAIRRTEDYYLFAGFVFNTADAEMAAEERMAGCDDKGGVYQAFETYLDSTGSYELAGCRMAVRRKPQELWGIGREGWKEEWMSKNPWGGGVDLLAEPPASASGGKRRKSRRRRSRRSRHRRRKIRRTRRRSASR